MTNAGFNLARRVQFGQRLAERLHKIDMTVTQLAEAVKLREDLIHNVILGGVANPSWATDVDMIIRVSEETNTSVGWLLGVEEAT